MKKFRMNIDGKEVCIICGFDISYEPTIHIFAIHTASSCFSINCSSIVGGKAYSIFYGIDIFWSEIKTVILKPG